MASRVQYIEALFGSAKASLGTRLVILGMAGAEASALSVVVVLPSRGIFDLLRVGSERRNVNKAFA